MGLPPDSYLVTYLPVRDLAATRDFYERDLGLHLVQERGSCLVFSAPGGGRVGFCQHESDAPLPAHAGLVLTLVTADVDLRHRRLRRLGAEVEARPDREPAFGTYRFSARDPDGYRVEVCSPDRPDDG